MAKNAHILASELRKHYFLDQYVIIAPKRAKRPFNLRKRIVEAVKRRRRLNIDSEKAIYELCDNHNNWQIKVVENKFSALSLDNSKAYGKQEVILETPYKLKFSRLSNKRITDLLSTYQKRIEALKGTRGIKYISLFKNSGFEAGGSLAHTHSQIVATGFIPPSIDQELTYFKNNQSPYTKVIQKENRDKIRVITSGLHFTTFTPYASHLPYEAWIASNKPINSLTKFNTDQLEELATNLKQLSKALDKLHLSFNYFFHEVTSVKNYHFVLRIAARPNIWAGFELDTNIMINPIAPEEAAAWYRKFH